MISPTDQQLRNLTGWLVVRIVEAERGLRSPAQLHHVLTQVGRARLTAAQHQHRPTRAAGPVLPADVRTVAVQRDRCPGSVQAVVIVRRDDRWEALHVHLLHEHGGWRIHDLQRPTPTLGHQQPADHADPPDSARRHLTGTRRASAAALQAVRHRAARDHGQERHITDLKRWERIVADYDRQLDHLERTAQHADATDLAGSTPPTWATRTLGPRPDQPKRRQRWLQAGVAVAAYRRRWGITSADQPLGNPTHPNQIIELNRILKQIDRLGLTPPAQDLLG